MRLPHLSNPIVDEKFVALNEMRGWMEEITKLVELLNIQEGSGDPNGVLKAKAKTIYFDNVGLAVYFKTTGVTLNTGWILLS